MEKNRISVKLCESSVGVNCSDVSVTFRLNLWQQEKMEAKRDTIRGGEEGDQKSETLIQTPTF